MVLLAPMAQARSTRRRTTGKILPQHFFDRRTVTVAKELLGKYLVHFHQGRRLAGRIVEVEAYVGPHDLACHASKGRTLRTDVLYGPPGTAYVYLIYGMYWCFNAVTEREGYPAAVLVRAVELFPAEAKVSVGLPPTLIDGPGRTCRSLHIGKELNRRDLTKGDELWIEDRGDRIRPSDFTALPRIGVDYAGDWAHRPYRFRLTRLDSKRR